MIGSTFAAAVFVVAGITVLALLGAVLPPVLMGRITPLD